MASKSNVEQKDQWFKFSVYALFAWIAGLVLVIVSWVFTGIIHNTLTSLGGILMFIAWIIVIIFGIFTIIVSLTFKNESDKILGIITGVLCIIFPLVGVIMAWIIYYNK